MSTTVKAVYEDGVFKPTEPVSLEDHVVVKVVIPRRRSTRRNPDDPTGWKAIDKVIGAGKAITPDASERHDDYLYGDPLD